MVANSYYMVRPLIAGERPYKCDICQRAFRVSSSFYAHVRTHTRTQADHPCAVCGAVSYKGGSIYPEALNARRYTRYFVGIFLEELAGTSPEDP